MFKVDLHTHSNLSKDGGITEAQYRYILEQGNLDCIAIADHNQIDFAVLLQRSLGNKIIVGEEIMTNRGEIIGLYLTQLVAPHQSPLDTAKAIRAQGGLVYIPHPFETVRHGLQESDMEAISDYIDIVEVHNGRAVLQNRSNKALLWSTMHQKPWAASSDAHGAKGLGKTYTILKEMPEHATLLDLVTKGQAIVARPPMKTLLYPKFNRVKKRLHKGSN